MLIFFIIIIVVFLTLFLFSNLILKFVFGKRCEENPKLKYYTVNDFEELEAKEFEVKSNKKQILRGKIYTNKNINEYEGVIVFVHGMGGGHLSYTTEINTFAKAGFIVLGYDNTGTCFSDGKNLKGFFQSVIDLKYVLEFVHNNENLNKYEVSLVGHSWGGYTVCQVLQFNLKIKSVVSISGCTTSENLISSMMGIFGKILKPFLKLNNFLKFGKKGIINTKKILKKSTIPILILHGDKDSTCNLNNSLADKEYFKDKSNIEIIIYENKYHNVYQTRDSEKYLNETFGKINEYKKKYKRRELEEKINPIYENIDYKKITEEDEEVMGKIVSFLLNKN